MERIFDKKLHMLRSRYICKNDCLLHILRHDNASIVLNRGTCNILARKTFQLMLYFVQSVLRQGPIIRDKDA